MRNDTRQAYNSYLQRLGQLNGVTDATATFTVTPSVQQTLETKIQESSEFLGKINIFGVQELEGEKIGLGISSPIASRTNTATGDRQTRDLTGLTSTKYKCEKTNFDTHITYAKLDAWAKFSDFQGRIRDLLVTRQGLDRMVIGFHGTGVAADTNIVANPMLQDVNVGWLQHMRIDAPARVHNSGNIPGKVQIGIGGDYENIDAAVFDTVRLLDPWYHNHPGLVCIMGRDLLDDKYFPIINVTQKPTETLAADIIVSQKRVGGLPAVTVPYFPDGKLLVTTYDNLSIYWQESGRRRRTEDNPKRDRIENYESSNDAYVIEDYGLAALLEKIEII